MSAFVVSHKHINTLITFWGQHCNPNASLRECQQTGEKLLTENIKSVNHRYELNDTLPDDYLYSRVHLLNNEPITLIQIIKAVNCWQYQSCEHDDAEKTEAWRIASQIKEEAIRQLPGYEEAEYEIE